ncbi:hypothetical protein MKEN_00211100 [Mycena kentingensis (nom. inval.)]|nr:hypothetical protein MKEN_00211100 [Mycena kentingensis (nom. inval.)]
MSSAGSWDYNGPDVDDFLSDSGSDFSSTSTDSEEEQRPMSRFGPRGMPPRFGPDYKDLRETTAKNIRKPNLRHIESFPPYYHCAPYALYHPEDDIPPPPPRHWCFLAEIVDGRGPLLRVRDTEGTLVRVVLRFEDKKTFDASALKIGATIAVLYAERFPDGEEPFMLLEHPQFVKVFLCDLETLLRINDDIEAETPEDRVQFCKGCAQPDSDPSKLTLRRCSRCLSASYCSSECQTAAWKSGHKRECKIFADVAALKTSRMWRNDYATQWVAFGEREDLMVERDAMVDQSPVSIPAQWKEAEPLRAVSLQGSFQVDSGELLWGQLTQVLDGVKNEPFDQPPTNGEDKTMPHDGVSTVVTQGFTYRTLARKGLWKIARVDGFGLPGHTKNTYLAYHASYASPVELLTMSRDVDWGTRLDNPRVTWVNRYDWGNHAHHDLAAARLFAALDPESGWPAAVERQRRLSAGNKYTKAGHPDAERWDRLSHYAGRNTFLVDAEHGVGLLKTISRPSLLDANLGNKLKEPTSLLAGDVFAVGCNLTLPTTEYEYARMIYSEEDCPAAPDKKELVAFWYEGDNRYEYEEVLGVPTYEDV